MFNDEDIVIEQGADAKEVPLTDYYTLAELGDKVVRYYITKDKPHRAMVIVEPVDQQAVIKTFTVTKDTLPPIREKLTSQYRPTSQYRTSQNKSSWYDNDRVATGSSWRMSDDKPPKGRPAPGLKDAWEVRDLKGAFIAYTETWHEARKLKESKGGAIYMVQSFTPDPKPEPKPEKDDDKTESKGHKFSMREQNP